MKFMLKRKVCLAILASVITILYLYLFFLSGVWYGNTFLYEKGTGHFSSVKLFGDFTLKTTPTEQGMDFSFTADDKTAQYRLLHNPEGFSQNISVYIYKNDELIFEGHPEFDGKNYWASNQNDEFVDVSASGLVFQGEDLFPTSSQLLNWYFTKDMPLRGNLTVLYVFFAVLMLLCISYLPKLLHGLLHPRSAYSNPVFLKPARILLAGMLPILMILSFLAR